MRKLKDVLRLRLTAGLSNRKIALITGIGKTAVGKHVLPATTNRVLCCAQHSTRVLEAAHNM